MRTLILTLLLATFGAVPVHHNPITVAGPIREISREGDIVTIQLTRNKYPVQARAWLPVERADNGKKLYAADLILGDSLEVSGDLERDVVQAEEIKLLLRVERRP